MQMGLSQPNSRAIFFFLNEDKGRRGQPWSPSFLLMLVHSWDQLATERPAVEPTAETHRSQPEGGLELERQTALRGSLAHD